MKNIPLVLLCFLVAGFAFSQKILTKQGEIKFEASMPAFEEVAAKAKTASCIFDQASGEFAALVLIKSFKFKAPLMEEHFNENYMESTKYPKATFKGKITGFDAKKLSATKTSYFLEGDLTIHGITKKIKTKINLASVDGKVLASSDFKVLLDDYKIVVPSLMKEKIAKDVKISLNFNLEPK